MSINMPSYYSWNLPSKEVAIKTLDKSAFTHRGTGIPKEVRNYFGIDSMNLGTKKEVTLVYNQSQFKARLELGNPRSYQGKPVSEESRLFWYTDLERILTKLFPIHFDLFSDSVKLQDTMRPQLRFEKLSGKPDTYYISFVEPENPFEEIKYSWKEEVLKLVREIPSSQFSLNDINIFQPVLEKKFPNNSNIKPKIRQQLQFLRDDGYIEFVDNQGTYRKLFDNPEDYSYLEEVIEQVDVQRNYRVENTWSPQKVRVGQNQFRKRVLWFFEYQCCVCQFNLESLLDAHHIHPWNKDLDNRLNPANGLSLCKIHHGAVDQNLLHIDKNHRIKVSNQVHKTKNVAVKDNLVKYHQKMISDPRDDLELML